MKFGRILIWAMVLGLLLSTLPASAEISVVVNGQCVNFRRSAAPYEHFGIPMVPLQPVLRAVRTPFFEYFPQQDLQPLFQPTYGFIRVTRSDMSRVQMNIGQEWATLNGIPYWLETPATQLGATILVPPKFLSMATGMNVTWDKCNQVVTLCCPR